MNVRLLGSALLLATALSAQDTAIRPDRTIRLFNGRNLDGLYTWLQTTKYEDPKRVFSVSNGMLRITGEDWGGITTRNSYRDYRLVMEWKWAGPTHGKREKAARDSGILVHATGADGAANGIWMESIEAQIIEGGSGDIILVGGAGRPSLTAETVAGANKQLYWKRGGTPVTLNQGRFNWFARDPEWKDVIGFRGKHDVEKPAGEWNISEVVCDRDRITNLVNGVVVNEGYGASHTSGKIQIQSEGAEIVIRKLEIRPVGKKDRT